MSRRKKEKDRQESRASQAIQWYKNLTSEKKRLSWCCNFHGECQNYRSLPIQTTLHSYFFFCWEWSSRLTLWSRMMNFVVSFIYNSWSTSVKWTSCYYIFDNGNFSYLRNTRMRSQKNCIMIYLKKKVMWTTEWTEIMNYYSGR